jgi:hypothetical protein
MCSHPTSKDHDLNKLESALHVYQEDFVWIWAFLALCFLRNILKDQILFLSFCNYLPFEEELTIYLKCFDFPSTKDILF